MSEKTELPSPEKMRELRESGIVPWSPLASCGLVLAGIGSALLLGGKTINALWTSAVAGTQNPAQLFGLLSNWIFTSSVLVAVLVLLGGLLQTRFFLSFKQLRFSAPKTVRASGLPGLVLNLVLLTLALAIGWSILRQTLGLPFSAMNTEVQFWLPLLSRRLGLIALLSGLVLFVVSWLFSELHFRLSHRVSRHEAESEPG